MEIVGQAELGKIEWCGIICDTVVFFLFKRQTVMKKYKLKANENIFQCFCSVALDVEI